eukprot:388799-Hanusia_phi.AAC.1
MKAGERWKEDRRRRGVGREQEGLNTLRNCSSRSAEDRFRPRDVCRRLYDALLQDRMSSACSVSSLLHSRSLSIAACSEPCYISTFFALPSSFSVLLIPSSTPSLLFVLLVSLPPLPVCPPLAGSPRRRCLRA